MVVTGIVRQKWGPLYKDNPCDVHLVLFCVDMHMMNDRDEQKYITEGINTTRRLRNRLQNLLSSVLVEICFYATHRTKYDHRIHLSLHLWIIFSILK